METNFGSCCQDLRDSITGPPHSFLHTEVNGVFYMAVGCEPTDDGAAFFDMAVLFCPFCGVKIQDREHVVRNQLPST